GKDDGGTFPTHGSGYGRHDQSGKDTGGHTAHGHCRPLRQAEVTRDVVRIDQVAELGSGALYGGRSKNLIGHSDGESLPRRILHHSSKLVSLALLRPCL